MNLQKFYMGESFDAYEYFGAHLEDGGVVFRTYAPNAHGITVVGEWSGWKEEPLQQLHQSGVWVGFSRDAKPGQMYKYVVYGQNGRVEHCDPYGFGMELRPSACSIIRDLTEYQFNDEKWMKNRSRCYDKPLNIYELHLGSWKMKDGKWYTYNEITDELIAYDNTAHLMFWDIDTAQEGENLPVTSLDAVQAPESVVEKELYQQAADLSRRFGVDIRIAEQCALDYSHYQADELTDSYQIRYTLNVLDLAFSGYPEGFLSQLPFDTMEQIRTSIC